MKWIGRGVSGLVVVVILLLAMLPLTLGASGCRYSVPAELRTMQAAVTDDQSITLSQAQRDLVAAGVADLPAEQAGRPASEPNPAFKDLDRQALEQACAAYRLCYRALGRTEASNWIMRTWLAGQDVRGQPKAKPPGN